MKYNTPEIKVIAFTSMDVITTSNGEPSSGDNETGWTPTSASLDANADA